MQDNNQAREFISALTGSPFSKVTFQAFYDPKNQETPAGVYPETWTATLDESIEFIDFKQSQLCGIYMCVNGTDGVGREADNITELRAVFVDFDGMAEPNWTIPPHLIQKRDDTHGHAFWVIDSTGLDVDEWVILQKHLSIFYGSDGQVIDPSRVMRVPGSTHFKDPANPTSYRITENNSGNGHKYSIEDIRSYHELTAEQDAALNQWVLARESCMTGAGYDNSPFELKRFESFATNAAHPAILGSGTHELFRVACYGHDHGIDLGHTIDILWAHYNPRCCPPWSDDERDHFESVCARAYKYPSSAAGCKSAKAQMMNLPPLVEPSCGWDNQFQVFHQDIRIDTQDVHIAPTLPVQSEEYDRGTRISSRTAVTVSAQLTAKSGHYDFAQVFDGLKYDGLNLIRSQRQFYRFKGKSWEMVDDDVIKAEIQRAYRQYRPANKFTMGVLQVLMDMVNVEHVQNGAWLGDSERDTSNLAVFQNGIVDLNEHPLVLTPHTHEFFVLNELQYDFDPHATCPVWHEFLRSIWGENELLKRQLQEFMGYCLTSDSSLQRFALFTGKSRGGKGTITQVVTDMVGKENRTAPSLSNLVKDSALHEMSKSSLTLIPEAHELHPSIRDAVLGNLKAITGGDPVNYHVMYKGGQSSVFSTKIIISTNGMPRFNDPSGALMNRALVFPFEKSFSGREDNDLGKKLKAELAGITQWAIAGLRHLRLNKGKFTEAREGMLMKDEMKKDMFPLSSFIDDCVILDPEGTAMLDDLYRSYRIWASSEGMKAPMIKSVFNQTLRNSALNIKHEGEVYRGMIVRPMMLANNVKPFGVVA